MSSEDFEYQLLAEKGFVGAPASQEQSANTFVDPSDGTVYEWDEQKRGWFPKINDDFLANYQANYGFQTTTSSSTSTSTTSSSSAPDAGVFKIPALPEKASRPPTDSAPAPSPEGDQAHKSGTTKRENTEPDEAGDQKKAKMKGKQPPVWFEIDKEKNRNVYISGLPLDITQEEFIEIMSKCGIIMDDEDGKPKVKLYRDTDGELKGDGLCCYLKAESIQLALNILDGSTQRNGHTISVQRAQFVQKGDYNPAKKKKKTKKKGSKQTKLLDWRERRFDGPSRKKNERILVFRNVFDPKEFDEDPTIITDIREDIQEECAKFGTVKKMIVFDRHPEGIVSVAFKEFEAADMCILKMNNRWYGGRQLAVSQWDGITNFQVEESDQEREDRLRKWESFLKEDEEAKEEQAKDSKKQKV